MLHNQSLRDKFMRGHAATITAEIDAMLDRWGDEGEIDLLDFTAELFIYTSSACLVGTKFRRSLDVSYAHLFHDLERVDVGADVMLLLGWRGRIQPGLVSQARGGCQDATVEQAQLCEPIQVGDHAPDAVARGQQDIGEARVGEA